ncbi:MAG: hypothetical protein QXE79_01945 [Candidatus Bathyarchaeia archaeon]
MKKVSLYIDKELWMRFKEAVLGRHGTLRMLSKEVESLLRNSPAERDIEEAFKGMGVDVKAVFSPVDVKHSRPGLQGPPSEDLIQRMRGRHIAEDLPR